MRFTVQWLSRALTTLVPARSGMILSAATALVVTVACVNASAQAPPAAMGPQAVPSGLFDLVAIVGEQSLPVRLELVAVDGQPWGRLTITAGSEIVAAVRGTEMTGDTWSFLAGGPIRGVRLRFADRVTGTIELGGSRLIPVEGRRTADLVSPAELMSHHGLEPTGLAARAGDIGASFPTGAHDNALIFTRHGPDLSVQTLMTAERSPDGWLEPRPLFDDRGHSDRSPAALPDGSAIVFASNRPVGADTVDGYRLWITRIGGDGQWAAPTPVAFEGGWNHDARQPAVTHDGTLYFSSDAPGGQGEGDIWAADAVAPGLWSAPRNLPSPVNSTSDEHGTYVSPDGSWMILASGRDHSGREGGDDLWLSRRTGDGWSALEPLRLPVNTFANEYGPWLSPFDGRLYFTSDRYGNADIFSLSAREAGLPRD